MINDQFSHSGNNSGDHGQFVISYELLALLRWMIEHDYDKFKKMITKALLGGLKEELNKIDHRRIKHNESAMFDAQQSIIDFFTSLEMALMESMNDYAIQKVMQKKLMPAIEHIDTTICDTAVVRSSIERVSGKIESSSDKRAQEVLFKELLRQWKPSKKLVRN